MKVCVTVMLCGSASGDSFSRLYWSQERESKAMLSQAIQTGVIGISQGSDVTFLGDSAAWYQGLYEIGFSHRAAHVSDALVQLSALQDSQHGGGEHSSQDERQAFPWGVVEGLFRTAIFFESTPDMVHSRAPFFLTSLPQAPTTAAGSGVF